jgi:type VI secretion system protein ImpK
MKQDNLALSVQEVLTVIARLRSNPGQVVSVEAFRSNVLNHLQTADSAARRAGYSGDDTKLAIFATVALLDESVLNSTNRVFADWHKEPLAQTLFRTVRAGDQVFDRIQTLLARDDSESLADVLEVYQLCLLLGFSGKYHNADAPELDSIKQALARKITRIRGHAGPLPPTLDFSLGAIPSAPKDPWIRRLVWTVAILAVTCLVCFTGFLYWLNAGVERIQITAGPGA